MLRFAIVVLFFLRLRIVQHLTEFASKEELQEKPK
jgi:hypothetical protein